MTARHDAGSSPLARGLRRREEERRGRGRIIPARAGFTLEPDLGAEPAVDHPRSRGVYCATPWPRVPRPGSSPLARGLQREEYEYGAVGRIIPARAGFTTRWPTPAMSTSDHPRSRGVYAAALPGKWIDGGSSPLARGLLNADTTTPPEPGIIPARAGFTTSSRTGTRPTGGSSPLARGLRPHPQSGRGGRRIIPARAGFTGCATTCAQRRRDHPRSRGVYKTLTVIGAFIAGSSPLARGLPVCEAYSTGYPRIIPARAGFTCGRGRRSARSWDHPRSRGVYSISPAPMSRPCGSSPLARGLLVRVVTDLRARGIIPARAGFTSLRSPSRRARTDHPRSRGVYSCAMAASRAVRGSSPLARGLLVGVVVHRGDAGIIPARAGFTSPSTRTR